RNYDVKWRKTALNELADIWLRAVDREAVNRAVSEIEARLEESPSEWGREVREGLRSFRWNSLRVLFYIGDDRKTVRIVAARWGAASNGSKGGDV
ncbi:MAG: type II toxin-antitoxin system RelE/ParE family toxin, partial [Pirellulales bacterium]